MGLFACLTRIPCRGDEQTMGEAPPKGTDETIDIDTLHILAVAFDLDTGGDPNQAIPSHQDATRVDPLVTHIPREADLLKANAGQEITRDKFESAWVKVEELLFQLMVQIGVSGAHGYLSSLKSGQFSTMAKHCTHRATAV